MTRDRQRYGRAFSLWRAAAPDWRAYVCHPFVQGLGDGTLPRAAFLRYLVQDYVFLVHFARAWALAVVKADTLDEMRAAAATVDALVNHEMALHVRTCAAAGITEAELASAEEAPGNLAYTRYVLEAGFSGDFLDLMAALAPCVLGYGEIGARLAGQAQPGQGPADRGPVVQGPADRGPVAQETPGQGPAGQGQARQGPAAQSPARPYAEWIATYAGEDYQRVCRDVGALIDAALARRLGDAFETTPRWPHLARRFATATRLEVGFWDMGLAAA